MMTHKQRMLSAARGEMADRIPFAPRLDLWYNANALAGTLPLKHRNRTSDEIARAEGWALHKVVPEYDKPQATDENLHRALGLYTLKEFLFTLDFSSHVEVNVKREENTTRVEYHTPLGMVSTTTAFTEEMKNSGTSLSWIEEHAIKGPEDYRVLSYLFENLKLIPRYEDFLQWQKGIGDDGLPVTMVAGGASPMHFIQRDLLDATAFYYHYSDYRKEIQALSRSIENFYEQALVIVAESPAQAVLWGGNFDDMLTYPPYFEKEILPWIRKAAQVLSEKGKIIMCHCDGENLGLMDMIRDSGVHVAESVCPYPMTKVKIEEYYRRWGDQLTIFGGIPSDVLLAELTTDEEFEAYMDQLFKGVVPGTRLILGIADATPANAVFNRLVRIEERLEKEGRLPLEGRGIRVEPQIAAARVPGYAAFRTDGEKIFETLQEEVIKGDHLGIQDDLREMIDKGVRARDILQRGLIPAMEFIGKRFKAGDVFIPEVLLSARTMNAAVSMLEPYLTSGEKGTPGKILIGTVHGDYHDIGKNIVTSMLRGVGFEVRDLGINIPTEEFVRQVADYKPDILALSALLTTTLPEMKKVIDAVTEKGLRASVKILVGGAPVNERFAQTIGADGYGQDAGGAVNLAKQLMEKHPQLSA